MFNEDNNGFINFPLPSREIAQLDTGKTLVYIVAFNTEATIETDDMSNLNIFCPGIFVSDNIWARPESLIQPEDSIDNIMEINRENDFYDSIYFPNRKNSEDWKRNMSFDVISSVCVGWSNYTYEYNQKIGFWSAGFKDLTNEGKKLYYSLRKLHNNKEVRILTFNNI